MARILVVDDSREVRAALGTLLELQGHNVSYAEDGAEVAALVQADRPALILLDILMPGLDGFSVLAQLRADQASRNVPVIVITALADVADQSRAMSSGAIDYITKPFSGTDVLARIDLALRRRSGPAGDRA